MPQTPEFASGGVIRGNPSDDSLPFPLHGCYFVFPRDFTEKNRALLSRLNHQPGDLDYLWEQRD